MKITHNSGPWSASIFPDGFNIWKDTKLVAESNDDSKEAEANAKLIAAAPEMLELLQEFAGNGALGERWWERVKAVIAKATLFLTLLLFAACSTPRPVSSEKATAFVAIGENVVYEWTGTPSGSSQVIGEAQTAIDTAGNAVLLTLPFPAQIISLDFYMDEQPVFVTKTGKNTYSIKPKSKRFKAQEAVVIWLKK